MESSLAQALSLFRCTSIAEFTSPSFSISVMSVHKRSMRAQLREARSQVEAARVLAVSAQDIASGLAQRYSENQTLLADAKTKIKDALILIERYEDPSVNSMDAAEIFSELRLRLTGMSTTTHTRDSLRHVLHECASGMKSINQTRGMNGYAYLERIKQHIQDLING